MYNLLGYKNIQVTTQIHVNIIIFYGIDMFFSTQPPRDWLVSYGIELRRIRVSPHVLTAWSQNKQFVLFLYFIPHFFHVRNHSLN